MYGSFPVIAVVSLMKMKTDPQLSSQQTHVQHRFMFLWIKCTEGVQGRSKRSSWSGFGQTVQFSEQCVRCTCILGGCACTWARTLVGKARAGLKPLQNAPWSAFNIWRKTCQLSRRSSNRKGRGDSGLGKATPLTRPAKLFATGFQCKTTYSIVVTHSLHEREREIKRLGKEEQR